MNKVWWKCVRKKKLFPFSDFFFFTLESRTHSSDVMPNIGAYDYQAPRHGKDVGETA
jgi:hypothetical protein